MALLSTWLNLEPSYLAQLCINTGANHMEEIVHLLIIFLKLWIFKKSTFCSFISFGIHHTHTHRNIDTHRHIHTQTSFLHFTLFGSFGIHAKDTNFIFGIPQTYTCTDTQTCTHIDTHVQTLTQIQIQRDKHVCIQTHAYTLMCMWEIYGNC